MEEKIIMLYHVVDCEHEGDVAHAKDDLFKLGATDVIYEDYEYEDDENPDADHEICGCTLTIEVPASKVNFLKEYGAY